MLGSEAQTYLTNNAHEWKKNKNKLNMNKFRCNHITWWPSISLISQTNTQGILIIVETDHMMIKDVLKSLKKRSFLPSVLSKKKQNLHLLQRDLCMWSWTAHTTENRDCHQSVYWYQFNWTYSITKSFAWHVTKWPFWRKWKNKKKIIKMTIFQSSGIIFKSK